MSSETLFAVEVGESVSCLCILNSNYTILSGYVKHVFYLMDDRKFNVKDKSLLFLVFFYSSQFIIERIGMIILFSIFSCCIFIICSFIPQGYKH